MLVGGVGAEGIEEVSAPRLDRIVGRVLESAVHPGLPILHGVLRGLGIGSLVCLHRRPREGLQSVLHHVGERLVLFGQRLLGAIEVRLEIRVELDRAHRSRLAVVVDALAGDEVKPFPRTLLHEVDGLGVGPLFRVQEVGLHVHERRILGDFVEVLSGFGDGVEDGLGCLVYRGGSSSVARGRR